MTISSTIRRARMRCRLDELALAGRLGVHFGAVVQWENGAAIPTADHLARLCDLLHLDRAAMFRAARVAQRAA